MKWFNADKGFGFIAPDDGNDDLFVHHSEVKTGGYASLNEGQKADWVSEGSCSGVAAGSGKISRPARTGCFGGWAC